MCLHARKYGAAKTRLERMIAWRDYEFAIHYEKDLKPTAFNLEKGVGGIMFNIRAERVHRLDVIIHKLQRRSSSAQERSLER